MAAPCKSYYIDILTQLYNLVLANYKRLMLIVTQCFLTQVSGVAGTNVEYADSTSHEMNPNLIEVDCSSIPTQHTLPSLQQHNRQMRWRDNRTPSCCLTMCNTSDKISYVN
jgi:hypothetical protein